MKLGGKEGDMCSPVILFACFKGAGLQASQNRFGEIIELRGWGLNTDYEKGEGLRDALMISAI